MKALVVAPQPFFTPRGTPFSVYYRTLVTAELGVEIDLLAYGQGSDVDIPGVRIHRIPDFPFLGEIPVGPSIKKLFLDVFIVLWTIGLLLRTRYDFVHAHEEAVFFLRFLKPLFGFKLVYDMHSSLPQQLTNFEFTTSRALIGAFRWLEDGSLRAADAVITICPDLADYVAGLEIDPTRHFLIENSIFDPVRVVGAASEDDDGASAPVEEPSDRLVVYAGTLEPYQGIDLLLEGFAKALPEVPDATLLVAGGRPDQVEHYRARAAELGIASVCTFTGRIPQREARAWCARAAVQTSPRISGTNTPLKCYEQLASGVPLVATAIYSHTQVLDDRVAFMVEPSPDGMARGLVQALCDEPAREARAAAARKLYDEKYSRGAYVAKLERLLERIR